MRPEIEERVLSTVVPDAEEIVATKDFNTWFHTVAPREARDTFAAWGDRSGMNGVKMARVFNDYQSYSNERANRKAAKADKLSRSVVEKKKTTSSPKARQTMSETDAFLARTKEKS